MQRMLTFFFGLMMVIPFSSQAFSLIGTRVVLHQNDGIESITATNSAQNAPVLLRARVLKEKDGKTSAPEFSVYPPLSRLESGGSNSLRIQLVSAAGLPVDRESLFYLDVTAIPASNPLARDPGLRAGAAGTVTIATGNVLKLIYRPKTVADLSVEGVAGGLQFKRVPGGVQVTNMTPHYLTLSSLSLGGKGIRTDGNFMLSPFSRTQYSLPSGSGTQIDWGVLDDKGNPLSGHSALE